MHFSDIPRSAGNIAYTRVHIPVLTEKSDDVICFLLCDHLILQLLKVDIHIEKISSEIDNVGL